MAKRRGIVGEFALFMKEHKSYWLLPLIAIIVLLAVIVVLSTVGGGVLSPWMYTVW